MIENYIVVEQANVNELKDRVKNLEDSTTTNSIEIEKQKASVATLSKDMKGVEKGLQKAIGQITTQKGEIS